ncbi:cytochrome P450 [Actinomadura macrotermitis]|uniref:cytochrome P450 n=1 Tax=Actinomadura macrotermitis TaxID=2585200 RepID=UPI001886A31C|nr:cytochrome P450 [Actinomadura macrotermitis]
MPFDRLVTVPFRRFAPRFARDPLNGIELVESASAGGDIVRLGLGPLRPYVLSRPEHIEHVMAANPGNYVREGWLWEPLSRLVGDTSGSDGLWWKKREVYQQLVNGPALRGFADDLAATVVGAVDELTDRARGGAPINASEEMPRIVYRAITKVLLGSRISIPHADRLGDALRVASRAMQPRLLAPFVPARMPWPKDREFTRALATVNGIAYPIVEQAQADADKDGSPEGTDIVSRLLRARTDDGQRFTRTDLRDGMVGLFTAGTETTGVAMAMVWAVLENNPDVAARVYDEVGRVVGAGPVTGAHLPELVYTRQVALEMLRIYPPGWMLPRMIKQDDVIGGVPVKAGGLIVLSPYLTHRLADVWPDPHRFDPDRHTPGSTVVRERHRYAYLSFGAGPHACVGRQFFLLEAVAIIAALVSRFRPRLAEPVSSKPRLGLTLGPSTPVRLILDPLPASA